MRALDKIVRCIQKSALLPGSKLLWRGYVGFVDSWVSEVGQDFSENLAEICIIHRYIQNEIFLHLVPCRVYFSTHDWQQ